MSHILTIIGARPQFIKAAAMHRPLSATSHRLTYLHTGQHYDEKMSDVFFEPLGLPVPDINLGVGGMSINGQVGEMMLQLDKVLKEQKPDLVIVYGDTNSTLAGSLAAKALDIPVAHVEAGLRSFNKRMPEETNRIVCDHCSTLLFTANQAGYEHLRREGFDMNVEISSADLDRPYIMRTGDVMYDNAVHFAKGVLPLPPAAENLERFALLTLHRPSNTDKKEVLESLLGSLIEISEKQLPIVWPLHPRTEVRLKDFGLWEMLDAANGLHVIPPQGYIEMIALERACQMVLTDSGGVQKEGYFHDKAVVVLREESEWTELIETGNARLVGSNADHLKDAVTHYLNQPPTDFPELYGDGKSGEAIVGAIDQFLA